MKLTVKSLKIILVVVLVGFGVGIYLQDLQHQKSTQHAWKANRYNLSRFDKITEYNQKMNSSNWKLMKDSIQNQLDTLMILRFRKEVDSINSITTTEEKPQTAGVFR
ncbi:hypothetical protein PP182_01585 [Maribacter sp. PR1]|uniref:Uncharacterized protein n=1 Tax=Maribacter cobaltidurans TaxID=1178778 RepID=A0ABU7IP67_9FLAO|nr:MULTISPECIES: hypothetical protein [Maribacter]MDC6387357.1 hypothetical protein [Maribacter sp. PR1]MEE1974742.1 hypothetical protein [Maribacter cobaltidurans]